MQTKIRVIEGQFQGKYKTLEIQILDKKYGDKGGFPYVEPIGSLTFQTNLGETDENGLQHWYGLNFVVHTDKYENLLKIGKLGRYIRENSYHDIQPTELIKLIGGVEYFIYKYEFIPVDWVGMQYFEVYRNGQLYSKLIAPNEIKAQKKLQTDYAKYDTADWEIKFQSIVEKY